MSFTQVGDVLSYVSSGDMSAFCDCAVAINASGQVVAPAAGGQIAGVLTAKPTVLGEAAPVQTYGIARAKLGGTVAVNDLVKVDVNGRFLLAASTNLAVGRCVKGGAINEIGAVLLFGGAFVVAP